MPPFSQRHAPPPRRLGPEIPTGVRRAIDSWLAERRVDPDEIRRRFLQRAGYGDAEDVIADVRDRWGDDEADRLIRDLEGDPAVAQFEIDTAPGARRPRRPSSVTCPSRCISTISKRRSPHTGAR
jgi:hypothetical protein